MCPLHGFRLHIYTIGIVITHNYLHEFLYNAPVLILELNAPTFEFILLCLPSGTSSPLRT